MNSSLELFSYYEAIAGVTARMLDAARKDDWNQLFELQKQYERLVDEIRPIDARVALDEAERQHKHELIRQILDNDAAIRDLASPRVARLSALLVSNRQTTALRDMYGLNAARG
ncbi:flagellar protein FliT [Pararobbsia silviterrae]|uniref:Flagellar protein FliT n=1 Tax=Pararobbsia silviterrae TaxID=1792498 RepID=A0A494X4R8_9BURK|nr:flagellar protein FliT [Pararobbsia silviterrae]RKP45342.1 flagellar protein FliT [Pararobbsia silviterrae]